MLKLPLILAMRYQPATDREVHGQSFGLLKAPRNPMATAWEQRRGTLEDQAIFGPRVDFVCACGKYRGRLYRNIICHNCGVKLTIRLARRQRFGHIDLPVPIAHPLGHSGEPVSAIPVLPAAFVESQGGGRLGDLYDDLVRSVACASPEGVAGGFHGLLELLLPAVLVAHEWNLQEADVLTRGMALVPRTGPLALLCGCGYPLEGLDVSVCPGCGKELR